MKQTVSKIPDHVGIRYKNGDTWNDITYQQYYNLCISAAKSFIKVQCMIRPYSILECLFPVHHTHASFEDCHMEIMVLLGKVTMCACVSLMQMSSTVYITY